MRNPSPFILPGGFGVSANIVVIDLNGNIVSNRGEFTDLISNALTVTGNASITGNLNVTGNLTYLDVDILRVKDPVIELGGTTNGDPLTSNDSMDRGSLLHYYSNSAKDAFMGLKNSTGEFIFAVDATQANNIVTVNSWGNVRAHTYFGNFTGDLNGTAANAIYADAAGNVVIAAQPNITSVGTLTGLTVNGTSSLGPVGNVRITGGNVGQVLSTNGSGNLSWTNPGFKYTKEFHVDTYNGNDTTGDGSYDKPFKTIMKAHSVMDNSGQALYIHAGLYSETVTWTRLNTDIIGVNDGGITYLQGAWTASPASSSIRIRNVMWGNLASLTHNSAGSLYLTQCTFSTVTFSKTGNGYVQTSDCDFGSATSFSVTGSGQVVLDGGMVSNIAVGNASALVSTVGCLNVRTVAVTAGVFSSKGSVIYSSGNTANAITTSAGTTTYLFETAVYTPFATPARVSLAGFNSINSSQYDAANSSVTGTNLGTVSYWDAVNVRGVSTLGAVGNVRVTGGSNGQFLQTNGSGTLAWATVNNVANANYANFAGTVVNASQPNITSVGTLTSLTVGGNVLPNANVSYDLGSPTQRWNTLYLSNSTMYLGNTALSTGANGELVVSSNVVATYDSDGTISGNAVNANYASYAGDVVNSSQPNITSVGTLTSLTVGGDATVTGNLNVSGNLTYIDVTNLRVQDPVIQLGRGPNGEPLTSNDGRDRGTYLHVFDTDGNAEIDKFMGWDNSAGEFAFGSNVTVANDVVTFNSLGNVRANAFIGTSVEVTGYANVGDLTVTNNLSAANITTGGGVSAFDINVTDLYVNGGFANLGDVTSVHITGGSNGQYLQTDGSGTLAWADIDFANASVANAGYANTAAVSYSVDAANVVGTVANANYSAYSGTSLEVANGTSSISIPVADGNIEMRVGSIMVIDSNAAQTSFLANTVSVNYDLNVGNRVYAASFESGGAITATNIEAYGSLTSAFLTATLDASFYENVTVGASLSVGTTLDVTGGANVGSLNVSGLSNLGDIANLTLTGGSNAQVLTTNGSGSLSWSTIVLSSLENGNSNVVVSANGNVTISSAGAENVLNVTSNSVIVTGSADVTGNVVADSITSNTSVSIGGVVHNYATVTTNDTTTTTLVSMPGTVRSAVLMISATNSSGTSTQSVSIVSNGSNSDFTTYGKLFLGTDPGTVDVTWVSGSIVVSVESSTEDSTTWKCSYQTIN